MGAATLPSAILPPRPLMQDTSPSSGTSPGSRLVFQPRDFSPSSSNRSPRTNAPTNEEEGSPSQYSAFVTEAVLLASEVHKRKEYEERVRRTEMELVKQIEFLKMQLEVERKATSEAKNEK